MSATPTITDALRAEFLQKLAEDARGSNGIALTEWEGEFLASWVRTPPRCMWFTEGRRKAVDRMWAKLGPELNHPHPADRVSEGVRMDDADPNGCEYLVRDEGRQRRCNEPAVLMGRRGLRYCQTHADEVVKAMRRAGKSIELHAWKGDTQ